MLADLISKQDLDIMLLQEVATPNLIVPMEYTVYHNLGSTGRGTAIVLRSQLELRSVLKLPSGRGVAADLQGLWIVNVYAPSGAERRREREAFFTFEVPYLLQPAADTILLGGDFNCILEPADSTGRGMLVGP
jgi:exonuclease III